MTAATMCMTTSAAPVIADLFPYTPRPIRVPYSGYCANATTKSNRALAFGLSMSSIE